MRISKNEPPKAEDKYQAHLKGKEYDSVHKTLFIALDLMSAQQLVSLALSLFEQEEGSKNITKTNEPFQEGGIWALENQRWRKEKLQIAGLSERHLKMNAYWTTALTMYVRCFEDRGLSTQIFSDPEKNTCHKYFVSLRNKHISHPQNIFERAMSAAELPSRLKRNEIIPEEKVNIVFNTTFGRQIIECERMLHTFLNLSEIAFKHAEAQLREQMKSAVIACEKLTLAELYSKPYAQLTVPSKKKFLKTPK